MRMILLFLMLPEKKNAIILTKDSDFEKKLVQVLGMLSNPENDIIEISD